MVTVTVGRVLIPGVGDPFAPGNAISAAFLAAQNAGKRQPKASIRSAAGYITLPFAPNDVEHTGFAGVYSQLQRPGRKPLVVRGSEGLRTMNLNLLLAYPDRRRSVESLIWQLQKIVSGPAIKVSLSRLEANVNWRCTDMTVTTIARAPFTNAVTRATVALTLVQDVSAKVNVGPVSGGKKPPKGGGSTSSSGGKGTRPRVWVVKAGETLSYIAGKVYGEPSAWRRIADANKIRDPRRLKVGQRLTIPARSKD